VDSVLSREEIEQAIRMLPDAGTVRLRRTAAACCLGRPQDAKDLLQEALARALGGSRKCPRHVDVVRFLAEVMHSISSDAAKERQRHPQQQAVSLFADDGALALDPLDCAANAEQQLASDGEVKRITQAIIGLFDDDPVAQVIVEGIMEDMEGEELRELAGLTKLAFASKRRLIRRRIEQAYPDGFVP
jgi:DNA-directed RNA polymerase specialized sigma24 family protein